MIPADGLTFEQTMILRNAEFKCIDMGNGEIRETVKAKHQYQERLPGSIQPFMEDPQEQLLKITYNEIVESKNSLDGLRLACRENTEELRGIKKYLSGCVIKQDENVLIQMIRHEIEQYLKLTELSPGINKEGFALLSQMVSYSYELEKENRELKKQMEDADEITGMLLEDDNLKALEKAAKQLENYPVVKNSNLKKKRGRPKR
jgi:hypothetical protein